MNFQVEKPNLEQAESLEQAQKRLEPLFNFIFEHGNIINPRNPKQFMLWWNDGTVKVFTAKEHEEIKAMQAFIIIPNPFDIAKNHKIQVFNHGQVDGFNDYINACLDVL